MISLDGSTFKGAKAHFNLALEFDPQMLAPKMCLDEINRQGY